MGQFATILLVAMFAPVLAQAIAGDPTAALAPLITSGPIGAVLAWFMWRNERRMRMLTSAVDRMTRASMLMVVTSKRTTDGERQAAREIICEVDSAQTERGSPL